MKHPVRILHAILCLACVFLLVLSPLAPSGARADFGDYAGDSDWGDSDLGDSDLGDSDWSSSDRDWDSNDWDWDSSDRDRSSSRRSSSPRKSDVKLPPRVWAGINVYLVISFICSAFLIGSRIRFWTARSQMSKPSGLGGCFGESILLIMLCPLAPIYLIFKGAARLIFHLEVGLPEFVIFLKELILVVLLLPLVPIYLLVKLISGKNAGGGSEPGAEGRNSPSPQPRTAPGEREQRYRPIEEYTALDPAFNPDQFRAGMENLYIRMQRKWEEKDIEDLRPWLSADYFGQAQQQLEGHIRRGTTNCVRNPEVRMTFLGFRQEGGYDIIALSVTSVITDYTEDDNTGMLVSGSADRRIRMRYEWELIRPSGLTGSLTGEQDLRTKKTVCPNCGAEVEINQHAKCASCGTTVMSDQFDFVLNKVTVLGQRTLVK